MGVSFGGQLIFYRDQFTFSDGVLCGLPPCDLINKDFSVENRISFFICNLFYVFRS